MYTIGLVNRESNGPMRDDLRLQVLIKMPAIQHIFIYAQRSAQSFSFSIKIISTISGRYVGLTSTTGVSPLVLKGMLRRKGSLDLAQSSISLPPQPIDLGCSVHTVGHFLVLESYSSRFVRRRCSTEGSGGTGSVIVKIRCPFMYRTCGMDSTSLLGGITCPVTDK
jgi:hypothetical protein